MTLEELIAKLKALENDETRKLEVFGDAGYPIVKVSLSDSRNGEEAYIQIEEEI